jgi:hypothetical protein
LRKGAELKRKEQDFKGFVNQNHFFLKGLVKRSMTFLYLRVGVMVRLIT